MSRVPGGQPDEWEQHRRIQVNTQVPEGKEQYGSEDLHTVRNSTEVCRPEEAEGLERIIEERLATVEFRELTKAKRPGV
jgi:hypothetical protein